MAQAKSLAGEDALEPVLSQATTDVRSLVKTHLGENPNLKSFVVVMARALEIAALIDGKLLELYPSAERLACKAGCSRCCVTTTVVTQPVFALYALYYAKAYNDSNAYYKALKKYHQGAEGCYLLQEDGCGIYPARPLICRLFRSYDFEECLKNNYLKSGTIHTLGIIAVSKGLEEGLTDLSIDCQDVNLRKAVELVFEKDGVFEKWLNGEKVFKPSYYQPN